MTPAKKIMVAVLCFALLAANCLPAGAADAPSAWAADHVQAAITAGLVPSSLQANYTKAATRAEFCALAVALYENLTGEAIRLRKIFADTNDSNAEKAAGAGLISGTGGGLFSPDQNLTREQAAALLVRIAEEFNGSLPKEPAGYADDGDISPWAVECVGQARAGGLMGDMGNNKFLPKGNYTIEQGIVTLYRLYASMEIAEQETPLGAFIPAEELSLQRQYEREVIALVNAERTKKGLLPLEETDSLNKAAATRAKEISAMFGHVRANGSACFTVLKEFEIPSKARAENIGGNYRTPEAIVNAWMNSEGHRRNILNPDYTHHGVSLYIDSHGRYSWANIFIG